MTKIFQFSYFILIFSLLIGLSVTSSIPGYTIDQEAVLNAEYSVLLVEVYRNETTSIRANLTLDGSPQSGGYFELVGINYDLGETIFDFNNGTYQIDFIPASHEPLDTGNYFISIQAIYQDYTTTDPFEFHLLSYDSINPELSVYSPISGENYVNFMFLNITGSDNMGWKELTVDFRGERIYTLFQIEETNGRGDWNETHVTLQDYVFFDPPLGDNSIVITLLDTSNNRATEILNTIGDGYPPSVELLTPLDGSIQLSREFDVTWKASDNIELSGFELRVNNFLLGEYGANIRLASIRLPVPEDERVELQLLLIATDTTGNTNQSSISFTYDKNGYNTIDPKVQRFNNLIDIFLWSFLGILMILSYFPIKTLYQNYSISRTDKLSKLSRRSMLPTDQLMMAFSQYNLGLQYISEIDLILTDVEKKLSHINDTDFQILIDDLVHQLSSVLDRTDLDNEHQDDLLRLIRTIIEDWKS